MLLLLDNHSSNASLVDLTGQMKVKEFALNYTSKHYPMDQGAIQAWETLHKTRLLSTRMDTMSDAELLHNPTKACKMKVPWTRSMGYY